MNMFSKKKEKDSFVDWAHKCIESLSKKNIALETRIRDLEEKYNLHKHELKSSESGGVNYPNRV